MTFGSSVQFSFDSGGLVSSALNFGLPSPINLQIEGRDMKVQHEMANELKELVSKVHGAVDVRIQETCGGTMHLQGRVQIHCHRRFSDPPFARRHQNHIFDRRE